MAAQHQKKPNSRSKRSRGACRKMFSACQAQGKEKLRRKQATMSGWQRMIGAHNAGPARNSRQAGQGSEISPSGKSPIVFKRLDVQVGANWTKISKLCHWSRCSTICIVPPCKGMSTSTWIGMYELSPMYFMRHCPNMAYKLVWLQMASGTTAKIHMCDNSWLCPNCAVWQCETGLQGPRTWSWAQVGQSPTNFHRCAVRDGWLNLAGHIIKLVLQYCWRWLRAYKKGTICLLMGTGWWRGTAYSKAWQWNSARYNFSQKTENAVGILR